MLDYQTIYDPYVIDSRILSRVEDIVKKNRCTRLYVDSGEKDIDFWKNIKLLIEIDKNLLLVVGMTIFHNRNEQWQDLNFLKEIRELRNLSIETDVSTLENLKYLDKLESFVISNQSTKKSLLPIVQSKDSLKTLIIDSKLTDIECITELINLSFINLLGGIQLDVESLIPLSKLESLNFYNSFKLKNIEKFKELKSIKTISFYRSGKQTDFSFLEGMKNLKTLIIDANKNFTQLPNIEEIPSLNSINLSNVGRIENLDSLRGSEQIEYFLHSCPLNTPKEYDFLLNLPNLKDFHIVYKTDKANKEFEEIKAILNKRLGKV